MNKVVHFEIPANDIERAKKFYREIFGWKIQDWPMPNGSVYTGVRTVEIDEKTFLPKEVGAINGAIVKKDEIVNTPVITVNVSSIDECVEKIIKAGGKLLKPKVEITGLGYYAYVQDTEGNLLALWQTLM
jgi:predicted enzyme related to lactoylglutathione lyase